MEWMLQYTSKPMVLHRRRMVLLLSLSMMMVLPRISSFSLLTTPTTTTTTTTTRIAYSSSSSRRIQLQQEQQKEEPKTHQQLLVRLFAAAKSSSTPAADMPPEYDVEDEKSDDDVVDRPFLMTLENNNDEEEGDYDNEDEDDEEAAYDNDNEDDDFEDDEYYEVVEPPAETRFIVAQQQQQQVSSSSPPSKNKDDKSNENDNKRSTKLQYAALMSPSSGSVGSCFGISSDTDATSPVVLQIQVGDITLARKAWKKRRRSGSPLLVPCSVMQVSTDQNNHRPSLIRSNLVYLLYKFGQETKRSGSGSTNKQGICISVSQLATRHRSHLKSSLTYQAKTLGFSGESAVDALVESLFGGANAGTTTTTTTTSTTTSDNNNNVNIDTVQLEYWDDMLWLTAPKLSRFRAHKKAKSAAILQFREDVAAAAAASEKENSKKILEHTGRIRVKKDKKKLLQQQEQELQAAVPTSELSSSSSNNDGKRTSSIYELQSLSAALRIQPNSVVSRNNNNDNTNNDDDDNDMADDTAAADASFMSLLLDENIQIETGSYHTAVVFDYDPNGDAGAPLLILSLTKQTQQAPSSTAAAAAKASTKSRKQTSKTAAATKPKYQLDDLKVGHGPIEGTVVRFVKGGVLVDCRVGNGGGGDDNNNNNNNVPGYLYFRDAVTPVSSKQRQLQQKQQQQQEEPQLEDDEELQQVIQRALAEEDEGENDTDEEEGYTESEEDVTHLFELGADGSFTYTDPETGETTTLDSGGFHEDDEEEEEDGPVFLTPPKNNIRPSSSSSSRAKSSSSSSSINQSSSSSVKRHRLHVGDRVTVYVKSVAKQSNQLIVTMNSSVQGKSAKELKKQGEIEKKLARLAKQLGGGEGTDAAADDGDAFDADKDDATSYLLQRWMGKECDGLVQATSHSREWLYVKPELDNLPVGVASASVELLQELEKGDGVRVSIEGVDTDRGQLSLRVIRKLQP